MLVSADVKHNSRQPTYWNYFKVVLQGQIYICQCLGFHSLSHTGLHNHFIVKRNQTQKIRQTFQSKQVQTLKVSTSTGEMV